MYEVISYKEKAKWEEKMNTLPIKDIFYFHSYCTLYFPMGDGEPYLFIYSDDKGNKISYVFFKRAIQSLPFIDTSEEIYDIVTPSYGYGGPLYKKVDQSIIFQFRQEFEEYCHCENIISEFVRFHPMYQNHEFLYDTMDVFFDRETVFIDLDRNEEDIMKNYHTNHRRNLKKALRHSLEFKIFEADKALEYAEEFYQLYTETMNKLNASKYSYFSLAYIKDLLKGLNNNSIIAVACHKGKMVSAALCIFEGGILHYHLGCSNKDFLKYGVNVYLFHHIILWAKYGGFRSFHLGGGHLGRDSLFQFKHKFNSEGTLGFFIGRKIHDEDKYNSMVSSWEKKYCQESTRAFFPAYRAKPIDDAINENRGNLSFVRRGVNADKKL